MAIDHQIQEQENDVCKNIFGFPPIDNPPVLPSTSTAGANLDKSPASHRSSDDVYVSPSVILPIPKATPKRKTTTKRKKGSSRIMTDSSIRDAVAAALEQRQAKKGKATSPTAQMSPFQKGHTTTTKQVVEQHDHDETSCSDSYPESVEYDDDSTDNDASTEVENIEGGFVVVKVAGRSSSKHYITRVDVVDDDEFEGVFLQKVASKVNA